MTTNKPAANSLSQRELSRYWGVRFRLAERVRNSLLVLPGVYVLAIATISVVLSRYEGSTDLLNLRIDNDTARTILSAIAGGMIAFTGLVVSIAVLVVQFAAGQYSPRLVTGFRRDPLIKHILGIFLAPAIFSLVILREIGRGGEMNAPSLSIGIAFLLLGAALLAFCQLVGTLLDLLRPRRLVAGLVKTGAHSATQTYPFRFGHAPAGATDELGDAGSSVRYHGTEAVLVALDRGRLLREAVRANVVIELSVGVGAYMPRESTVFKIHSTPESLELNERELQKALITGIGRTVTQDPAFAMRAMVDMAVKALSPAVNDPTTAVEVLDGLETFLLALAWRDLDRDRFCDSAGKVRLIVPNPDWEELLDLALTEIRHYGAAAPQVSRRMKALLVDLTNHTPDERNPAIEAQIERFEAAVKAAHSEPTELAYALTADRTGIGSTRP